MAFADIWMLQQSYALFIEIDQIKCNVDKTYEKNLQRQKLR